jgi:hypothetical protein
MICGSSGDLRMHAREPLQDLPDGAPGHRPAHSCAPCAEYTVGGVQSSFGNQREGVLPPPTPGWEARPAAEFSHFGESVGTQSIPGWLAALPDQFLASIKARSWLIAGPLIIAFGLGLAGGANFGWRPAPDSTQGKASLERKSFQENRPDADVSNFSERFPSAGRPSKDSPKATRLKNSDLQNTPKVAAQTLSRTDLNQQSRPSPVPETKPRTIEGWSVRSINGESVVLIGPERTWTVKRGETVPGIGRIDTIVRWGNRWIVATSSGLISTD